MVSSNIVPLPVDEEDAIIHSRITNDERALRRVVKKFSGYTAIAYPQLDTEQPNTAVEDAREAFLLELSSFSLQLKKVVMVCEAEARQVEEYYREKQRIEDEHNSLKGQIEQLKTSLEHAQVERKRKIEYDSFAEKINTLPSRTELERSIQLLENDMAAIRADQDAQSRHLQSQRASLVSIISDLSSLRLMTKDTEVEPSHPGTPDLDGATSEMEVPRSPPTIAVVNEESPKEEGEEGEAEEGETEEGEKRQGDGTRVFVPSRDSTPVVQPSRLTRLHFNPTGSAPPSTPPHRHQHKSDDDIEMGELAEEPEPLRVKKRSRREDLEEGEASDESSELSDPPDD
ncbi:Tho complex subunit 7-domain-containing protein [Lactarius indigo]|nr:Tho complex subunit 7-domain-containing protein [Lactarius indigo]